MAALRHPLWLGGVGADVGGVALQVLALHLGGLIVVQLVLVSAVLFSLVVAHWIAGTRMTRRELLLGAVLVVAVTGFLLVSGALRAVPSTADRLPAILAGLAILAAVVTLVAWSRRFSSHRRGSRRAAAMLGTAVGAIYAGTAALIKTSTNVIASHGVLALLTSWQLYCLIVAGVSGLLLAQMAFQAGPLTASLPATATVDPLISVLLGVIVFDEQLTTDTGPLLLTVLCLLVMSGAVAMLSQVRAAVGRPTSGSPSR